MAIVSIFSGPFCHGDDVVTLITEELGYRRIETDVLDLAAREFSVSKDKLVNAMAGSASFFDRFTKDREKHIAYIRYALAQLVQDDNVIHHGFAGHLIPRSLSHVLRVCLIANHEYRVKVAMEESNVGEKQAADLVQKMDKKRAQWTQYVNNQSPYDPDEYDLLLAMHDLTVEEAASKVLLTAGSDALRTTDASKQAAVNFLLAAKVHVALAEKGHLVDVQADNGAVTIAINKYTARLETLQKQLQEIALGIDGVRSAKSIPGIGFVPPSLMPKMDLPKKALLVDDEVEFVHSLSERLETRQLDSSVVYDGEQALEYIRSEQPDVIVLDLKMPGIDGIEVLRRVKQDYPEVEVIILTGHGSDREEQITRELGAFAYLTKPVNIEVLADAMKAAYGKAARNLAGSDDD